MTSDHRVERLEEVQRAREALASGDVDALKASVEELIEKTGRFQQLWIETVANFREYYEIPAQREIERLRSLLSNDQDVERAHETLKLHYKEAVYPINYFCSVIEDWFQALRVAKQEWDALADKKWRSPPPLYDIIDRLSVSDLAVVKSNYLYRRLYLGEPHRTEKCPQHQGRWSGYAGIGNDCPHGCSLGPYDITGWLPKEESVDV